MARMNDYKWLTGKHHGKFLEGYRWWLEETFENPRQVHNGILLSVFNNDRVYKLVDAVDFYMEVEDDDSREQRAFEKMQGLQETIKDSYISKIMRNHGSWKELRNKVELPIWYALMIGGERTGLPRTINVHEAVLDRILVYVYRVKGFERKFENAVPPEDY